MFQGTSLGLTFDEEVTEMQQSAEDKIENTRSVTYFRCGTNEEWTRLLSVILNLQCIVCVYLPGKDTLQYVYSHANDLLQHCHSSR